MSVLLIDVHLDHTVTYEVPEWVGTLIQNISEQWPLIYGRRPKFTIARGLELIEQAFPGTRSQIKTTRKEREKAEKAPVRGSSFDWVYHEWMEASK